MIPLSIYFYQQCVFGATEWNIERNIYGHSLAHAHYFGVIVQKRPTIIFIAFCCCIILLFSLSLYLFFGRYSCSLLLLLSRLLLRLSSLLLLSAVDPVCCCSSLVVGCMYLYDFISFQSSSSTGFCFVVVLCSHIVHTVQ